VLKIKKGYILGDLGAWALLLLVAMPLACCAAVVYQYKLVSAQAAIKVCLFGEDNQVLLIGRYNKPPLFYEYMLIVFN